MEKSHTSSRSKASLGGKKSKGGKKSTHKMSIERGKKGGFVVHHHSEGGPEDLPEIDGPHVVNSLQDLHGQLDQQMGDQPPAMEPPPQVAAGPQQVQPTPGM
jgi:hypothetical protein